MNRTALLFALVLVPGCTRGPRAVTTANLGPVDRALTVAETATLDRLKQHTESLRGHRFTRTFDARVVDPRGMRARYAADMDSASLDDEAQFYRALGLLPFDSDLNALYLSHSEREVVGAYSPRLRTMFFLDEAFGDLESSSNVAVMARLVLVHELVHALQDDPTFPSSAAREDEAWDDARVRSTIVEGDATFAMVVGYAQSVGVDPASLARNPRGISMIADWAISNGARADEALPAMIRLESDSQYVYGAAYVAHVFAEGGWDAVDALHVHPPASMEQIIHFARTGDVSVPDEITPAAVGTMHEVFEDDGYERDTCDTLGELGMLILFDGVSGAVTPRSASDGWSGDLACVFQRPDSRPSVQWVITWDSIRDAVEAEAALEQVAARFELSGRAMDVYRIQRAVLVTIDPPDVDEDDLEDALYYFVFDELEGQDVRRARR